ncbi:MAG: cell division protein FtsQ/DivIB [Actinomycetota bacterium]
MTDETTPSDGAPRVTGETPVVRAVSDVPAEVLDELTTAFEKHTGDVPVVPSVSQTAPTIANTETVLIDGYDLVADDDLTHARKPPLVIEDNDLTGPVVRTSDEGDGSDGVVKRDRRFRLRRIAVRRAEGRRRLRIVGWVLLPLAVVGIILAVLASPLFGVRNIVIDGARYTAQSTLESADDLVRGKSVFSLDLGAVEEVLKADPWVRDAQAKRRFPSTVVLDIAERKPIAWYLGADNQARVIDIDGRVITVLNGQPTAYTQITGIGPDLPAGSQADDVYAAAAQVAASLPPEVAPLMLNMGATGGTDLLMTLRTGTVVTFGRPTDLRSKMVALVLVLRRTDPKSLNGIDLSSGDPILAGR